MSKFFAWASSPQSDCFVAWLNVFCALFGSFTSIVRADLMTDSELFLSWFLVSLNVACAYYLRDALFRKS